MKNGRNLQDETGAEPLRARLAVAGPEGAAGLKAGSVAEFMVMPAGDHTCWFGQGDARVRRTVRVDRGSASALQQQLTVANARSKQRAYFDFDHQDAGPASGWPLEFAWRGGPVAGVYCRAELSEAGARAITGRDYRAFSPVFYVTRTEPATVICREDGDLCMGSLVNKPAFHEIEPLWARERAIEGRGDAPQAAQGDQNGKDQRRSAESPLRDNTISAAKAAATQNGGNPTTKGQTSMEGNATAVAATPTQASEQPSDALKAKDTKIVGLEAELQALKAKDAARRKQDAETAVADAVRRGKIPAQDDALRARWTGLIEENPDHLVLLAAQPDNPALGGSVTRAATAAAGERLQASEGPARIMKAYGDLVMKNTSTRDLSHAGFRQRGDLAREMAALYARDIAPRFAEFRDLPLRAAEVADANLGTLSGTLVAQRTLELFKLSFPALTKVYTDFSDLPAQFKQTEATRIVVVPAVQSYSTTADGTGRPAGWSTVSTAQTKDVLITLDEHIGVPIVFDANMLASTVRRLFDEQAPAASYALAKYFVEKIYKLFTPGNYNAYAAKNGAYVPKTYANYPVGLGDFARSTLAKIAAIFNPNQVPIHDRFVLLTSDYFEQLATDPSLVTFFSGQRAPEIITESRLPRLAGFEPIEAPNLTAPAVTPNLVGMALQRTAVVAKTRLSNDYTLALPGSSYGSVTTVTEPDLGISVVLVQYVNHTGGYAEWRLQVMLGAAVGDNRGGLCITSS